MPQSQTPASCLDASRTPSVSAARYSSDPGQRGRRPGPRVAGGWIGQHIQDDGLATREGVLQGRTNVGWTLDADAFAAELPGNLSEIVLAKFPAEVRFGRVISAIGVRFGAPVGAVCAIVVDHYDHRYLVACGRLQLRQVVIEAAVAGEADHRST